MKIWFLLAFIGLASASLDLALAPAFEESAGELIQNLEREARAEVEEDAVLRTSDDPLDKLQLHLKKNLEEILEKIQDRIDQGKTVSKELVEKVKELVKKLKDAHVDLGKKIKGLIGKIKDRVKDMYKDMLDDLKDMNKRGADFDVDFFIKEIKEALKEKIHFENMRAFITKYGDKLVKVYEELREALRKGDLGNLKEIIKRVREDVSSGVREKRGLREIWEHLVYRLTSVKKWLEDKFGISLSNFGAFTPEKLRQIAKRFMGDMKSFGSKALDQFWQFFRLKKEDLKDGLDQIRDAIKERKREIIEEENVF